MAGLSKKLSQHSLVRVMEAMEKIEEADRQEYRTRMHRTKRYIVVGAREKKFWSRLLYEKDFPELFIKRAQSQYNFDWDRILRDLRSGSFFLTMDELVAEESQGQGEGEQLLQRLAALASLPQACDAVRRSLELDGFLVDTERVELRPLEGPISEQEEEDRFTLLIRSLELPAEATILKHLEDAGAHYREGTDHSSLGESRSFLQALIDQISGETDRSAVHSRRLPGGTKNRIEYLKKVGFLTGDEELALKSAWGTLCAGSHPGVPSREEARIGLILGLEFGQLLLLKFGSWKANSYKTFSPP